MTQSPTYTRALHDATYLLATSMGIDLGTEPLDPTRERATLRALMNLRDPAALPAGYVEAQAIVLDTEREEKGTLTWEDATASPLYPRMALWRGDITRLKVDAIVNAANSALLGCRAPGHSCIDNAIHSAAGLELREACAKIMEERYARGVGEAPTGDAEITPGFHLPARFVLHTVGPIVSGPLRDDHRRALASSYRRCLEVAAAHGLSSVAFCCVSTGVFGFPQEEASRIAVTTVNDFLEETPTMRVLFDVFSTRDEELYRAQLGL